MLPFHTANGPRPGGTSYVSPEGIIHCTDGKFRWVYERDQRKQPTVLLSLLWKCMAAGAVAGAVPLLLRLGSNTDAGFLSGLLAMLALITAGALVSLVLFAAHILQNGLTQCLLFTADESMISCQQVKGRTSKEKVAHAIAAWVGGQSQPSLRFYDPCVSHFDTVTVITPDPRHDRIRLSGTEGANTVCAEPPQFSLVLDYLKRQCPQAKWKE